MPSIKTITPLLGGSYYHLFNRGINKQNIFFQEKNYLFFLQLLDKYLIKYIDVLAFCLLPNHFHLVIRIKDEIIIKRTILSETQQTQNGSLHDNRNVLSKTQQTQNGSILSDEEEIGKFVSNQIKRAFISYAMAINKQENRVGALFDAKFKRLEITQQEYLQYLIFYAHYNPEKHGLINNFRNYRFSSYKSFLSKQKSKINRNLVFDIFDGKDAFLNFHEVMHEERKELILE